LQTLATDQLSTQEIAERLPDIPKSSIYRHLKVLLDGGVVQVSETRPVKGVEEKVYQLISIPDLQAEDLAAATPEDHLRYFASYVATLLHGFEAYLDQAPHPDFYADRVGYREATFYVTDAEFDQIVQALNSAIVATAHLEPGPGRRRRKFATITHPLPEPAPGAAPEVATNGSTPPPQP
jgi:hypothetical protein